jgi:uncharacterized repeat protein (TIGR01451 family)
MKTTRVVNILVTFFLLCTVSVVVCTVAASRNNIVAQGRTPSLSATNRISTRTRPEDDQATLLVDTGELRLWGVSWSTGRANGVLGQQPAPMDVAPLLQVPDLMLVKEADPPDGLHNNDTLTFTLTLSGAGLNVELWDPLPESVNYVEDSVTEPASYDLQARAITWQGTLPSDSPLTVRFQVTPTISGTGVLSLAEAIINTAWMTDTDNDRTVVARVSVNAHRIYLPLLTRRADSDWDIILQDAFEGSWPGPWELDYDPGTSPYLWAKRDCRPYGGGYSAWVVGGNSGSSLSCGANYPDNLLNYMIYGPFSLESATAADLTFQLWLDSVLYQDEMYWGAGLTDDDFYGYFLSGSSNGWEEHTLDLRAIPTLGNLTGQPQVWIVLAFISDAADNLPEGAYVDDVLLRKSSSMPAWVPWQEFSFTEPGIPARGCQPADPGGAACYIYPNAEAAGPPPWVLSVPSEGAILRVTDGANSGDVFDVYDFGNWIGRTSAANTGEGCFDPNECFQNPAISSGEFPLAAGQHSITIVPSASPYGFGAAFFRVD